jgi:hypothetical protein
VAVEGWELLLEGDPVRLNVAAAILEANGIPVETFDDTAYGPIMDARLFVPTEHLEAARRLLEGEV